MSKWNTVAGPKDSYGDATKHSGAKWANNKYVTMAKSSGNYIGARLESAMLMAWLQTPDSLGQTVVYQPIATNNGYYTINTATFSSGLYYVALYSDTGKIFGDKLNIISK